MKNLILISSLLLCLNVSCQGLDDDEFELAKTEYKSMVNSNLFQQNMKDQHALYLKMNGLVVPQNKSEEELREWFTKNLSKTHFTSIEEAVRLQVKINESNKKIKEDYKDVLDDYWRASINQRVEIGKSELDLMKSFPRE